MYMCMWGVVLINILELQLGPPKQKFLTLLLDLVVIKGGELPPLDHPPLTFSKIFYVLVVYY